MNTEKKLSEMSRIELMKMVNDLLAEQQKTLKELSNTKAELSKAYNFILVVGGYLDPMLYQRLCDKYLDS